jgi:hypothetical protein
MPEHVKTAADKVSPKVISETVAVGIATVIGGAVIAITPEHFAALGIWGPVLYGAVVAGAGYVAGWLKGDPLRRGTVSG